MYYSAFLAYQIAKEYEYLKKNKFFYQDIPERNCLISGTNGNDKIAKIADFGMARDIYKSNYYRKVRKAMLPAKWIPCEAFLDGIFKSKSHIWMEFFPTFFKDTGQIVTRMRKFYASLAISVTFCSGKIFCVYNRYYFISSSSN
uniref:receptor protein-tyrosine kinase n=1 Tax=Strongyloides venezuelensis TaxID=75913 RepID=A0A0K0FDD9_STRVS